MRYLLVGGLLLSAQSLSEAELALVRENYDRVIAISDQIISAKPKETYAYYLKGQAYIGQYRQTEEDDPRRPLLLRQARETFNAALAKNAKYPFAHIGLAEVELLEKNSEAAKSALSKAEEYGSTEVKALIEAARVYALLGGKFGIDKATFLLSKAKSKDPNNTAILRGLGDLWMLQGVIELGIDNYQKAVAAEPNNPENHFKLGQAYLKAKSYKEAGEAFRKATEVDPSFAPAYRELGEIFFLGQRYQQAKEYYQKYITIRPELSARVRYATFLYLSKDYKAAIEEIRKVFQDTFSLTLQRLLGYSLSEDGQHAAAIQELNTYFARQAPAKVIGKDYFYYAKSLSKTGQDSLSVHYYRLSVEKDSSLAKDAYPEMVNILNNLNRFRESADILEKMIAKNPSLENYYKLGRVYYRIGQKDKDTTFYHKAIAAFSYIKDKKPDFVPVYTELGRCAAMLDPESTGGRALPYYEKVVELAKAEPSKYKSDLIEAYSYLGYYFYVKENYERSYEAYTKLQELDPQNPQAAQALPFLREKLKRR
ncbi:MAG: tetratricopeptide repeat protein [Bacteroidia bacterium]|nr:tetratricopeptide repeat protein [Bacteroidia bacterium]MCX7651542.1 tetratricopeptide repeat protein [Bacteroidia bacterium]MDW8416262.1 tetratricopeptide repeat protein [Bacteroidia bacterium]